MHNSTKLPNSSLKLSSHHYWEIRKKKTKMAISIWVDPTIQVWFWVKAAMLVCRTAKVLQLSDKAWTTIEDAGGPKRPWGSTVRGTSTCPILRTSVPAEALWALNPTAISVRAREVSKEDWTIIKMSWDPNALECNNCLLLVFNNNRYSTAYPTKGLTDFPLWAWALVVTSAAPQVRVWVKTETPFQKTIFCAMPKTVRKTTKNWMSEVTSVKVNFHLRTQAVQILKMSLAPTKVISVAWSMEVFVGLSPMTCRISFKNRANRQ